MQVYHLTSIFACGIFLLAPKIRTTPLMVLQVPNCVKSCCTASLVLLADTSYFHQCYLLSPHVKTRGFSTSPIRRLSHFILPGSTQKGEWAFNLKVYTALHNVNIAELEIKTVTELR